MTKTSYTCINNNVRNCTMFLVPHNTYVLYQVDSNCITYNSPQSVLEYEKVADDDVQDELMCCNCDISNNTIHGPMEAEARPVTGAAA